MDSKIKLYLERAENKLILARTNFDISISIDLKKSLRIPEENTFFNDVISDSYYCIFYTSKAYLILKGIITNPPEEHKKTYESFKKFVDSGILDSELLTIYDAESEKADYFLNIFSKEKSKRGRFTYNVNSNANIPFAEESLKNAKMFLSRIKAVIEK